MTVPNENELKALQSETDIQYLERSIHVLSEIHDNTVKAFKQVTHEIHEIEADKKVCTSKRVIHGIEALLKELHLQKAHHKSHLKNIKLDLKHYRSIYKKFRKLEQK
ncbi:MAG: hypothetical protein ACFFDF_14170 [Candidatus Odinarchaeota archaeon]